MLLEANAVRYTSVYTLHLLDTTHYTPHHTHTHTHSYTHTHTETHT
jgi:hypothetical protein